METQPQKAEASSVPATPFADFKEALGPMAAEYSDGDIEIMRGIFDGLADIFYKDWIQKRNSGVVGIINL